MEGRLNSELKVDVPLASKEDLDDDAESVASNSASVSPRPSSSSTQQQKPAAARRPPLPASVAAAAAAGKHAAAQSRSSSASRSRASPRFNLDDDSAAGSLEDLVNSFDEKITKVFQDYQENVSKIAPVQVLGEHRNRKPKFFLVIQFNRDFFRSIKKKFTEEQVNTSVCFGSCLALNGSFPCAKCHNFSPCLT